MIGRALALVLSHVILAEPTASIAASSVASQGERASTVWANEHYDDAVNSLLGPLRFTEPNEDLFWRVRVRTEDAYREEAEMQFSVENVGGAVLGRASIVVGKSVWIQLFAKRKADRGIAIKGALRDIVVTRCTVSEVDNSELRELADRFERLEIPVPSSMVWMHGYVYRMHAEGMDGNLDLRYKGPGPASDPENEFLRWIRDARKLFAAACTQSELKHRE